MTNKAPKTIKAFIKQTNIHDKLVRAVVAQSGDWESFQESAPDIASYGAAGGFSGFTYNADTVSFARKHKAEILEMAKEQADNLGVSSGYALIASFNCLNGEFLHPAKIAEIINGKFNAKDFDYTTVFNALAWYTLEEVSRAYTDILEG